MKECFKCGTVKPLSDFYNHKQMADGHLNKCKDCTKRDVKRNRDDNVEYYRGYDSWRYENDPKVKERHIKYSKTESCAISMRESSARWRARNPNARAAHIILGNAVRGGRIDKPVNCSCCGKFTPSRRLHGHHHDYAKPLDVTWLCDICHAALHKGENDGKARKKEEKEGHKGMEEIFKRFKAY